MKSNPRRHGLTLLAAFVLFVSMPARGGGTAQSGDTELSRLMQCAFPDTPGHWRMDMKVRDSGEGAHRRVLSGQIDISRSTQTHQMRLLLEGPEEVAGSSYFLQQSDNNRSLFMYLPALEKVHRLSSHSQVRVLGSELPLEALFTLFLGLQDATFSAGRAVDHAGRRLQKVYSTRFDDESNPVSHTLWLDPQSCQLVKLQSSNATVVDLVFASEKTRWPRQVTISPGSHTGAQVTHVELSTPLATLETSPFTAENFYR